MQEIEKKRTELLPEHQKMQKRTQKLQSEQEKRGSTTRTEAPGRKTSRNAVKRWRSGKHFTRHASWPCPKK